LIVVDTLVWIEAPRDGASAEAAHLKDLLDDDEVALAAPADHEAATWSNDGDFARMERLGFVRLHRAPTAKS
jgi:hypothetical protein